LGVVTLFETSQAHAEQVIADNLVVQGNVTLDQGILNVQLDDTPTLQLQQTTGGGFPAYQWDLGGNEIGLFFNDVTSNTFPFGVEGGAPDDTLRVAATGNVGIGTFAPASPLHVLVPFLNSGAEQVARFEIADDSVGRLLINNNSSSNNVFHPRIQGLATSQATPLSFEGVIDTDAGQNPCISFNAVRSIGGGVVNRPLVVFRNNVTVRARLAANGDFFATSFSPLSTRTRKENITELASRVASEALDRLTPVEYVYKDDESREPRLGFIAEDVPDLVANADRQSVPIMDVLALVTRVVKDQHATIRTQQETIDGQETAIRRHTSTIDEQQRRIESQNALLTRQAAALADLTSRLESLERRLSAPE